MARLGIKFLDGSAKQERPVKYELDELPETFRVVFRTPPEPKKTAVYERVDTNGEGEVGHYLHVETVDELRLNR